LKKKLGEQNGLHRPHGFNENSAPSNSVKKINQGFVNKSHASIQTF